MDLNQDEALKADAEVNSISESPADETNLSEVETPVEESTEESTDETQTEDKKSAAYRIRELNEGKREAEKKASLAEERAKSLEDKIAELTQRTYAPQVPEINQPEPLFKPGEEYVDPLELERRLQAREEANFKRTQALLELQTARERNLDRINVEAQASVVKHPQLNPDSEHFDKDLSDTVSEAVEAYIKSNPTGSVKTFVDKLMNPYTRSVEKKVGEQREAVAKQASQTALRPTHVTTGEKKFEDMTLAEMEKHLGGVRT